MGAFLSKHVKKHRKSPVPDLWMKVTIPEDVYGESFDENCDSNIYNSKLKKNDTICKGPDGDQMNNPDYEESILALLNKNCPNCKKETMTSDQQRDILEAIEERITQKILRHLKEGPVEVETPKKQRFATIHGYSKNHKIKKPAPVPAPLPPAWWLSQKDYLQEDEPKGAIEDYSNSNNLDYPTFLHQDEDSNYETIDDSFFYKLQLPARLDNDPQRPRCLLINEEGMWG